jgi:hypothetical protein
MANQLILGRALDANGYIAPGAKAAIYADGTSTLISVYSDSAGTVAATNPIVADADGFWPQRFVTEDAKAVVTTSADVALYTLDPAPAVQGTGAAASQVSFSPTVELPQTNVQDAIVAAADLAVSGFATYGIGITGNATLLANLDATGTGAGIYRFDGTSTGTFPTGVVAGDTGMIELWRQAGATAMMELHHATSNRLFRRRMTASVWGAWREVPVVNQATAEGDIVYRGAADFQRLAKGADEQVLTLASGVPSWADTNRGGVSAATAASSGTAIDIGSIPAWATRVWLLLSAVSLSGTDDLLVQIGDSGGIENTGYVSGSREAANISTAGFIVFMGNASRAAHGVMELVKGAGNQWFAHHAVYTPTICSAGGGTKTLSDTLTQVRLTRTGTDTLDGSGTITVRWA